jgi:hemerythrin
LIAQIIAQRIREELREFENNEKVYTNLRTFFVSKGIKRVCKALYRKDKPNGFIKTHYANENDWLLACGFNTDDKHSQQK